MCVFPVKGTPSPAYFFLYRVCWTGTGSGGVMEESYRACIRFKIQTNQDTY